MDLAEVDRVARDTLGFQISPWTARFRSCSQTGLVRHLVKKTSPASRRAFAFELYQRHEPYALITNRSRTVEITRKLRLGETPTEKDIVNMVKTFLREMRDHAYFVTVLKRLLLNDLSEKIENMCRQVPQLSCFPRKGSRCILSSLRYGTQRLESETFLLR